MPVPYPADWHRFTAHAVGISPLACVHPILVPHVSPLQQLHVWAQCGFSFVPSDTTVPGGRTVGGWVGNDVGETSPALVGAKVGFFVGGFFVGKAVGVLVGNPVGNGVVGKGVGTGALVGCRVGRGVGFRVGFVSPTHAMVNVCSVHVPIHSLPVSSPLMSRGSPEMSGMSTA